MAFLLQVSQGPMAGIGIALVGKEILDLLKIKIKNKKKKRRAVIKSVSLSCAPLLCLLLCVSWQGGCFSVMYSLCGSFHQQRSSRSMCRRGSGTRGKGPMNSARTGRNWKGHTFSALRSSRVGAELEGWQMIVEEEEGVYVSWLFKPKSAF